MKALKIATFNINGIRSRLPVARISSSSFTWMKSLSRF